MRLAERRRGSRCSRCSNCALPAHDRLRPSSRQVVRATRGHVLAHDELLHLAGDRHRELLDEADVARDLEVRDLVLGRSRGSPPRSPARPSRSLIQAQTSSPYFGSGTPITSTSLDLRVCVEELLDLAREDVLAAADHHVLDAPDDLAVAVLVEHREVAAGDPARRVDGLGGASPGRSSSRASRSSRASAVRPACRAARCGPRRRRS